MKIRPLSDRVVVRRSEAQEKTAGGILLPDAAKNKPQRGEVLAVGEGKLLKDGSRRPLQIQVGDQVLFTNWAGEEYRGQQTGNNILLMREEDILAVIGEGEDEEPEAKDPALSELTKRLKGAHIPKGPLYDRRTELLGKRPNVTKDEVRSLIKEIETATDKSILP